LEQEILGFNTVNEDKSYGMDQRKKHTRKEGKAVQKGKRKHTLGKKEDQCRVKARNGWIEDQPAQKVVRKWTS
jgi:hypothetical protein